MAIRDCGAVLEIEPSLIDRIAKAIPSAPGMTIDKALVENPQLAEEYKSNSTVKKLIDTAKSIEGIIRQTGSHAAGIIISDKPLYEYGALMEEEDSDIPVFLADMKAVEYLKLLKMDYLGLKTLTVEDDCCKLIKNDLGIDIKIEDIPKDDKKVYEFISTGNTTGCFQLENGGMQSFMRQLQPECLEDLIIGISMYRPGPLDKIPQLIDNKRDTRKIRYPLDAEKFLKPILDVTYGIIVYQEQCMEIVKSLAGYDFGRADLIRRAMAKKKTALMEYERQIFVYGAASCPNCNGKGTIDNGEKCPTCEGHGEIVAQNTEENILIKGCIRNNITPKTANKIYDDMVEFAKYAFNKSHATAYAYLAYDTSYLMYYFPKQYMCAYLNSIISNQEKVRKYMGVSKLLGINILRPDINRCYHNFTTCEDGIRMGLTSLKYVGLGVENAIIERDKNSKFKDLQDLLSRVELNKREVESLIKSGALDTFSMKRSVMLNSLQDILERTKKDRKISSTGQFSIFDMVEDEEVQEIKQIKLKDIEEYTPLQLYSMEKEVSGFYLSGHPLQLDEYKDVVKTSTITTIDNFTSSDNKKKIKLVGIVQINEEEKEGIRYSKNGTEYANFTLEDEYGTIKVLGFKDAVQDCKHNMYNGNIVQIEGTLSVEIEVFENDEGELIENKSVKIFLNNMVRVTDLASRKKIYIKLEMKNSSMVKNLISRFPGLDEVIFIDKDTRKAFKYNNTVGYSEYFKEKLAEIVNIENIAIR